MDRASELQSSSGTAPHVSVVVPSYNHARFVETTLRSIAKQTTPPKELMVIDDGSSDDSPQIIERVLREFPFPSELIARENRGLCATLNEGLAKTSGKYFAYLGSDDLWLPDFLRERVQLLESRAEAVLAYGHAYFIDEENRVVDCTADWARYVDGDVRPMLLKTIGPMSPTVLYRRNPLENQHWDERARLEDYDLYLRLSEAGPFAFDPQILSAWRRHGSNVSWDQTLMLDEQLKAQREAAARFGMNDQEIEKLQRATRFARAEDFMRVGEKSRALSLMLANLGGASSLSLTGRMLVRLLTPYALIERRQARRQQEAADRYGVLQV
jgi:alpha-1,3-rhamnosyltransferase